MGVEEVKKTAITKLASNYTPENEKVVLAKVTEQLNEIGLSPIVVEKVKNQILVEAQTSVKNLKSTQKAQQLANKYRGGQK